MDNNIKDIKGSHFTHIIITHTMLELFTAILGIGAFLFILTVFSCIHTVKHGQCLVIERFGKYDRTLDAGIHIVWPWESARMPNWTWQAENVKGQKCTMRHGRNEIPTQECELDTTPFQCFTNDQVRVDIDCTIMYKITNAYKAVYSLSNAINFLVQNLKESVKAYISKQNSEDIFACGPDLANESMKATTIRMAEHGIQCTKLLVQNITMSAGIMNAKEEALKTMKQEEARMQQQRAEYTRKIHQIENEKNLEDAQAKKQMAALQHEINFKKTELEAELDRISERDTHSLNLVKDTNEVLKGQDFSPSDILEYRRIESMRSLYSNKGIKTVYLPSEAMTNHMVLRSGTCVPK